VSFVVLPLIQYGGGRGRGGNSGGRGGGYVDENDVSEPPNSFASAPKPVSVQVSGFNAPTVAAASNDDDMWD
jgi:hypothetical protein